MLVTNNNIKSLLKTICTCDDEQHGPKTEQQSSKEINDHLHHSSFQKTLDIKLPHLQSFSNMNNKEFLYFCIFITFFYTLLFLLLTKRILMAWLHVLFMVYISQTSYYGFRFVAINHLLHPLLCCLEYLDKGILVWPLMNQGLNHRHYFQSQSRLLTHILLVKAVIWRRSTWSILTGCSLISP